MGVGEQRIDEGEHIIEDSGCMEDCDKQREGIEEEGCNGVDWRALVKA